MDSIIVGFSRPKTWKPFSWLIMTAYGNPFSHAYIKFYSKSLDRWIIYQASGFSVNFMNIQTFEDEEVIVYEKEIEITQEAKTRIIRFAMDNCGKPYGIKQVAGLGWVRLQELLFRKEIKNPLTDGIKSFFCSELVALILSMVGIKLPKAPEDMAPKDVFGLLKTL